MSDDATNQITTGKGRLEWTLDELDVTPNEDLRELIEKWRDNADGGRYVGFPGEVVVAEELADELEELMGDRDE